MIRKQVQFNHILLFALSIAVLLGALWPGSASAQDGHIRADAVVLVNSTGAYYADFAHYIQPYLDNFGVPYTVLDIASTPVEATVSDYALIIVGHRQLDPNDVYLDATEEVHISAAVNAGTGLVNFDNNLAIGGSTPRYQYIQDIFNFGYVTSSTGSGVTFTDASGGGSTRINCWEDAHQVPVLTTTTDPNALVATDNAWTEFEWTQRGYPGVFGGYDELLPLMRFYGAVPDGEYTLVAHLYWSHNLRYYWGYTPGNPQAYSFDVTSGNSGNFADYTLGTVQVTGGEFNLYVQNADPLPGGNDYPFFGWAWINLVPVGAPPAAMHYITARHQAGESISTGSMTLAGITLPAEVTALAMTGSQPFLAVTTSGQGRAVQWGTYNWMSHSVKGPVYGLDDLVWRSIVWAARKPFVMQGMPPFITMRVDDESGPFWWVHIANEFGIKPWAGLFFHNIDDAEAADLSSLVHADLATTSIHAFNGGFFYSSHGPNWPDDEIAAHYAEGTAWHQAHDIPIAKYVLAHYYELGSNAFGGLSNWGVEFVGLQMNPGTSYGAPWIMDGPYRRYESGGSSSGYPMYYGDFTHVPGHPEFDGQFFNCVTEIRDDAGYEWYPNNDVAGTIGRGTRQTKRALDSMVLATLFTHGQHISGITPDNWRAILQGITTNIAPYNPIYVTMDYACQYVRATATSNIAHSEFNPLTGVLATTLTGVTDMPTQFYLFTECGSEILEQRIDTPVFSGSTQVVTQLPGALHRIEVSPAAVTLGFNDQQQFMAQGYDANDVPVVCADYTWDVVNSGGTITQDGLFTAGTTAGTFVDTVTASDQGITGTATVAVAEAPVDHFTFHPIGDQVTGIPFTITITALDTGGTPVTSYDGTATLTDTTGTIVPTATAPFVGGMWTGTVSIAQAATGVVISAQDFTTLGTSNPFTVTEPPPIPAYQVTSNSYVQTAGIPFTVTVSSIETTINLWENEHQAPVLTTFTDWRLLNDHDGQWDEFWYTSGRPYPTLLAGHNEWENNNLQPMHFFAEDVPNGRYRVWANLYTAYHTRYFYGYTEVEARTGARWVDNVAGAGGSDQHDEYSLGIIEINNNRFDLWAGDGDLLSGSTLYFYGWAWIRLEPDLPQTRVNLWEDNHQAPVLTTFTDWRLLNDHDGQWDEFLYTPSRPYPTLLAGHNEWENNNLQPMHLFADGLPNGTYQVWANLYTSRYTRHYYGFAEAEARAGTRWVDNVAGAGGQQQHAEYSLGTVTITDGRFDLWVGDGDLLAGTPYFYGWAWVRLVASGMTMSSSSPTMRFDGDRDGTFGEPGDDVGILVGGTFDIAARDTTAGSGTVITATDSAGFWGRATYIILPGALNSVEVEPAAVTLPPHGQQQFVATGLDQWGNSIAGLDFDWDVVNGGGTIDGDGLFNAGFAPGVYHDTVVAVASGISGAATVTVELVPADHFEFESIYEPQYAGVPIEVVITALDDAGAPVTDYNDLPTLSDTTGTISPATIGPFTDGVWHGYVTIGDVADDVVITADDGTAAGNSDPFDVLAMPEHIYSVTSASYVQAVGQPFAVTVAPISHTINLWEDAHQRPVLQTTTNAGDLNTTDGQWTEFHYVAGGRPFPSVMAGVDEENYGLPTMHFYAVGIPNGTYEAIANLYTAGSGRDMRYYYGFAPENPKALYVDTTGGAGGSDQHEEYSLGQVTITDGRFDLYVRDADMLGGTYPIFGWAWVRLEPVFPERRINLWEDAHQDPMLTTTTAIPDLIPNDNRWTEFLYSVRGYPAVFAGYNEFPPLMRFHAEGIPNGEYTLIANLYWSHNLRYYWGYSADNPQAYSYDVTSGHAGDFAEYLIDDSVTVTDNTFELYVNNADPLPGGTAYEFYGWAWVRLVPTRVTMSSSSPTMRFDGDGDGTFGEPGDDVHLMTGEPFTTHALDTAPGTNVLITATDDLGGTGIASYTILDLDHITVMPDTATLDPGATQQFTAQAYDSLGNPIPGLDYTWSVVNGGGTIDENGLFTAGTVAGEYPNTVVATYAGIQGTASVIVPSGPPVELEWAPVYGPQYATVPFLAELYALDEYGNIAAGYDGVVNVWDTTGTLVPGNVTLVDGRWTGDLRIDAVADDVVVSASDGTLVADTNPFDVLPAPEQSYIVSSASYLQTAGVPFTVTVTAISSTVNLWENNHQHPALATFTDPLLFNYTDGEWDEFLWVGHRDYSGVFGGISEAISETLETMHFYAVVPNGTYRLIANLYRSNDYRYFYGFDPSAMRAHWVDVTSGPVGDFAEFDLGTVTITDNRFNLYTDHADVIVDRGAFPAFGWAWVRLVPVMPETQINLWEDDHQDPVLATTTNAGNLNPTDGQWTEFHYVAGGRPFPSVFAGADEENYGLPTMHFYAAEIPNGTYEVIANLYTSGAGRNMRYYYGFTSADPEALYVDTAGGSGGADEHTEYSLGTITITDGHFDLYVRDADRLPGTGTYPFFGWAWVRLIANRMTMSSSSPTMLFDGDGNGTFGEPDDDVGVLVGGTFDIAARETAARAGIVITATDNAGNWGAAIYTVTHATAVSIDVTPIEETVAAGEGVTYHTTAQDVYGNTWDVTTGTTFTITPAAGGDWADNAYTSQVAGDWMVTGEYAGLSDTATLHVVPAADLSVTKTASPNPVRVETMLTYTVAVTNNGPSLAMGVTVTDTLPSDMTFVSAMSSQGDCSGTDTIVCDLGNLPNGATATVTIVVTPTATGTVLNTAEAAGTDPSSNPVGETATAPVVVINPSIAIAKAPDAQTVPGGSTVVFTIAVTNTGDAALTDVTVTDALAPDCVRMLGSLDAGFSVHYTCSIEDVTADFTNSATAESTDPTGGTVSATDTAFVDVLPTITVTKAADPSSLLEPGGTVTFTVRVTNTSEEAVTLNSLEDNVHDDLDGQGTCSLPQAIPAGGHYTCAFSATVSGNAGHTETDTVTASGTDDDGNPVEASDDATVTVTDVPSAIAVTKTADPTSVPEPGGTVAFTVRVDNTSTVDGVTITILTDSVHGNLNGQGTCATPQTIPAGESYLCTFSATVSGNAGHTETDTVTASGSDDDGYPVRASDDAAVTVTDVASTIAVSKTAAPSVVRAGNTVHFTIRVDNLSVEPVTLVGLDDTTFGSLATECSLPVSITVGSFFECAISRTIQADHTNTVTATAEDDDGNQITASADASVDVIGPAIQVVKQASASTAKVGEMITYTYAVENVGDVTLTNVSASDNRLGAIAFDRTTLEPGEATTATATYLVLESDLPGPLTNTVTITGTPPVGADVTNTATVTVAIKPKGSTIYLPIVLNRSGSPAPDLVVERITVTGQQVQVVIKNQGNVPVSPDEEFWVDLYVNPNPVPTGVNQTWNSRCSQGIVWGITAPALPLGPGGTITLTIGDAYYWPEHSKFSGPLPAGTPIYVQVDSANVNTTYGAVLESHEITGGPYNNVGGPVFPTLSAMREEPIVEPPVLGDHPPAPSHRLPRRP